MKCTRRFYRYKILLNSHDILLYKRKLYEVFFLNGRGELKINVTAIASIRSGAI